MGGVRDGYSNFAFLEEWRPIQTLGTTQITGATIDKRGYETVTFLAQLNMSVSGVASGAFSPSTSAYFARMQHAVSNAAGALVWSNCQASQMLFDGTFRGVLSDFGSISHAMWATLSAGSGADEGICIHWGISDITGYISNIESQVMAAGYIGTRRWVRLMLSWSANADISTVGAACFAILGKEADWPVNYVVRTAGAGRNI